MIACCVNHGESVIVYTGNCCPMCDEINNSIDLKARIEELQQVIQILEEEKEELENERLKW